LIVLARCLIHGLKGFIMQITKLISLSVVVVFTMQGCAVGPDYVKPAAPIPVDYKEMPSYWKQVTPLNNLIKNQYWWALFHDKELNRLEHRVAISNQSVGQAAAQYIQAQAIVDQSRASFFPTLLAGVTVTRAKTGSSAQSATASNSSVSNPITAHQLSSNIAWTPDIWGNVRRTVEASKASAESYAAALAAIRLTSEAALAQYYFQLRTLDNDQQILDDAVKSNKALLAFATNRFKVGVAGKVDAIQAKTQLELSQATAIRNGISRAQYEHAIAVLVGLPPAYFNLAKKVVKLKPPIIPVSLPSTLLARRPDVVQAERLVEQASAQIGIAKTAYYPVITLTGLASETNQGFSKWLSVPALSWVLGLQLAQTLYDGGLRRATVAAAYANLEATAANYQQTVLTAFQSVEDNLVAIRLLKSQSHFSEQAAVDAHESLRIFLNQYAEGTVDYLNVLTAQNTALTADRTAVDVRGLQLVAAVGLVKALGGGWTSDAY
jgi:NodT family efflux transporter outer membrane factor (OMF) lipoprotein